MKVKDLQGAKLSYFVAKAEGIPCHLEPWGKSQICVREDQKPDLGDEPGIFLYDPHEDWSQGGPIIEREHIWLAEGIDGMWRATMKPHFWDRASDGPTPLIAAMRAFVASKFGEEVE